MKKHKIAFIGAGNMARAIISGLIAAGVPANNICAANKTLDRLGVLQQQFNVQVTQDNRTAAEGADVVILSVKPSQIKTVCAELKDLITATQPLVISVAAGISLALLEEWLGRQTAIVRTMPNITAMVGAGATALCANQEASTAQRNLAESIFCAVGMASWLDESQINIVNALSGSGPAYVFLTIEAMQQAARELGMDAEDAKLFALQTVLGAARMALESKEDVTKLRQFVTSPNGTTHAALEVFKKAGFMELYEKALAAACSRAEELADLQGS